MFTGLTCLAIKVSCFVSSFEFSAGFQFSRLRARDLYLLWTSSCIYHKYNSAKTREKENILIVSHLLSASQMASVCKWPTHIFLNLLWRNSKWQKPVTHSDIHQIIKDHSVPSSRVILKGITDNAQIVKTINKAF